MILPVNLHASAGQAEREAFLALQARLPALFRDVFGNRPRAAYRCRLPGPEPGPAGAGEGRGCAPPRGAHAQHADANANADAAARDLPGRETG